MASPHHNVSIIGRSKGRSAVAAAAYRHATQMQDRGTRTNDYSKKAKELVHSEIALPAYAPAWVLEAFGQVAFEAALSEVRGEAAERGLPISDERAARLAWAKVSERLWNAVEAQEDLVNRRRAQAQLARSVTLALPRVLSREAQVALMRGYVAEVFTSEGMIADWVLHDTGDGNPHVHVMLTMRDIREEDWGLKNEGWNKRSVLTTQRKVWADHANLALEREGFAERIDHRSLKAQALELEPEAYNPHVAEWAELNGETPREKLRCAEVRKRNQAYLRAHPDHILAVVQTQRAVFGETDVRRAFATRLGLAFEAVGGELDRLVTAAMSSPDLLPVVGARDGEGPLYITMAKARMAERLARDAKVLAESKLALVAEAGVLSRDGSGQVQSIELEKGKDHGIGTRHDGVGEASGQAASTSIPEEESRSAGSGAVPTHASVHFAVQSGGTGRDIRGRSGVGGAGQGEAGLSANAVADVIEFGTGPIVVDIAAWNGSGNDGRRVKAAAGRVAARGSRGGSEPPRVYRRLFCSRLRRLYQGCSGLHRMRPPVLVAAGARSRRAAACCCTS